MRRANYLLPGIADPDNLRLASWKAAKGKRYAREVLAYQEDLEENLWHLREQIQEGKVEVGDYRYFKVYEPKERQICASAFGEQVLHHALMNVCHDYFERAQVYDSYASRVGKGTYACLARAKDFTHRYPWYLKLDVRKFFQSIHHSVLKGQLARLFKEQQLLEIFYQVIDSYEASPDRGLPIGNLTSQYFANHYLCGLDHFIKEQLGFKAYVRYMDDMVLWAPEKAVLKEAHVAIADHVENKLRCELKPESLNRSKRGLPFLGYRIFPHHVRLLQKSKVRFIRKISKVEAHYQSGEWSEIACQRRVLPLIAFTVHADAKIFRKDVLLSLQGQPS
ncbi:MAG: RNA-directed DNA polymerase [Phaeodactylibacter sp.]|nr:RNA-directed DNA polymerase [Phaeodactylibacter sp.]